MAQPIVKYTLNKKGQVPGGLTLATHHLLVYMVLREIKLVIFQSTNLHRIQSS